MQRSKKVVISYIWILCGQRRYSNKYMLLETSVFPVTLNNQERKNSHNSAGKIT
jgi:hypothetical protein